MIKLNEIHTFSDPFVSAASGLVLKNDQFYLISDDENYAVVINKSNLKQGKKITLFPGTLSDEKKIRKKTKADLESIVELPTGDLLCIPSGSKLNRHWGALIRPDIEEVERIDFSTLYFEIIKTFSELNIEGAVIINESLRLFQRGNGGKQENGTIDINLQDFFNDKITITSIKHYDLGKLNGANLSFTDATVTKDKIYFLAVAEDCASTYLDGDFKGAVLGLMNLDGIILQTEALEIAFKPEGLCTDSEYFYVVTDADDHLIPSRLFKGNLPKI